MWRLYVQFLNSLFLAHAPTHTHTHTTTTGAEAPNGVALCTEFRTDNTGPPASPDEVIKSLNAVREEYPSAKVIASTFDAFLEDVEPVRDQLPVVTGEVGDTWIYGVPSDPLKVAQNRVLQRVLEECIANESPEMKGEKSCKWEESKAIQNFTRFLHKAPEHTYGKFVGKLRKVLSLSPFSISLSISLYTHTQTRYTWYWWLGSWKRLQSYIILQESHKRQLYGCFFFLG